MLRTNLCFFPTNSYDRNSFWLQEATSTSPVANAVQRLEDLVLVVDLTHSAFLLIEEDAVIRTEALVEVGTEVQRHRLHPNLGFHLEKRQMGETCFIRSLELKWKKKKKQRNP